MMENSTTRQSVLRLASERPDWLPVLQAACRRAKSSEPYGGEFAGRWVLNDLANEIGQPAWRPGLRLLVGYGLLEKAGESTRGGRRAYYRMPEREGIEAALAELMSLRQSDFDAAVGRFRQVDEELQAAREAFYSAPADDMALRRETAKRLSEIAPRWERAAREIFTAAQPSPHPQTSS